MAPAAGGLLIFLIVPFFMAFYLSLTDTRLISPEPSHFVGLDNYARLFRVKLIPLPPVTDETTGLPQRDESGSIVYPRARTILHSDERYAGLQELTQISLLRRHYLVAAGDPVFLRALLNNFTFVFVVTPLQCSFALLLAVLVHQKLRGVVFFRTLYFIPVVTTMVVVSVIWTFLYNPGTGTINAFLHTISFGLIGPQNWLGDPRLAFPSIMLLSIWQGAGFQMVIFLAGLQGIPSELYEAAAMDGCNKLREFFWITLPQLRNTTIFVLLVTTIWAFQLFVQVDIMTGGGPSNSTMTTILHAVNEGFRQQRIGNASAITVVFFLIVLAISMLQRRFIREERAVEE
jgi:multiple sugar transport system permease protein